MINRGNIVKRMTQNTTYMRIIDKDMRTIQTVVQIRVGVINIRKIRKRQSIKRNINTNSLNE